MEGTEHPARFVSELATDQGSIGEYLMAEVFDRQPEPIRRMLAQTSFLPEVTGPLAEAITGLDGCADMLAGLARTNSFVARWTPPRRASVTTSCSPRFSATTYSDRIGARCRS